MGISFINCWVQTIKTNLVFLNNVATRRNVDTIEETTDILVADESAGVDISAGLGNSLDIVTGKDDLILKVLISGTREGNALTDTNGTNDLLTDEVADLDVVAFLGDGDGEVVVSKLHAVEETLGDTDHHVLDVGDDSAAASETSTVAEPKLSTDGLVLVDKLKINLEVIEVLGKSTTRTSDGDGTTRDGNLN